MANKSALLQQIRCENNSPLNFYFTRELNKYLLYSRLKDTSGLEVEIFHSVQWIRASKFREPLSNDSSTCPVLQLSEHFAVLAYYLLVSQSRTTETFLGRLSEWHRAHEEVEHSVFLRIDRPNGTLSISAFMFRWLLLQGGDICTTKIDLFSKW